MPLIIVSNFARVVVSVFFLSTDLIFMHPLMLSSNAVSLGQPYLIMSARCELPLF